MNELNLEFNNYIEEFKKLNIDMKLEEIVTAIKELVSFIDVSAISEGIKLEYLKSSEILDIKKDYATQDDYLEAILVYIELSKHLLAQYLESKSINEGNPII